MQPATNQEYEIKITDFQRLVMVKALREFVRLQIGSTETPAADVCCGIEMVLCLDYSLSTDVLSDITPVL